MKLVKEKENLLARKIIILKSISHRPSSLLLPLPFTNKTRLYKLSRTAAILRTGKHTYKFLDLLLSTLKIGMSFFESTFHRC